jgi:flagellar motor protein MotB
MKPAAEKPIDHRMARLARQARWDMHPPTERDSDGWLLTYLDIVTLLLVLMVVMLSFSTPGKVQPVKIPIPAIMTDKVAAEMAAARAQAQAPARTSPPRIVAAPPPAPVVPEPAPAPAPEVVPTVVAPAPADTPVEVSEPVAVAAAPIEPEYVFVGPPWPPEQPIRLVGSIGRGTSPLTPIAFDDHTVGLQLPRSLATEHEPAQQHVSTAVPAEFIVVAPDTPPTEPLPTPVPRPRPTAEDLGLAALGDEINVIVNEESVSFRISNEILFPSGQATLSDPGLAVLDRLAELLAKNPYQITVEGHTDPIPIQNDRFPSNWELSTWRATSVLRHLERSGIAASRLRATGYADTRPLGTNDTADGRAANRRVELIMETRP